jgi:hypothetical protein
MKKAYPLVLALAMSLPFFGFSQENRTLVKSKTLHFFGEDWTYQKFSDGTKTFEAEVEDKNWSNDSTLVKKNSKYSGDIVTDLGINLWNPVNQTPAVKPWGSWNVEVKYLSQYKATKNFHLNTSLGVNWFNYKLEDRDQVAVRTSNGIAWEEFTEGVGTKSKISASYANLTFIPTLVSNNGKLRLGVGGYAGLRLGGRGKFVYDDAEGNSKKQFEKANMFANNFRYGLRTEIGVGDVTVFATYDLNDFFLADKGPEVQAISFGISLR